ncbi:MAG: tRNA preQ1(34) S-adenosylmethionine ribosyltransferase-isomerase QueA [Eubacterium sp.]|nr:tRNA preQ1(34) S-adenosylmethionine ribosyltransferase-isomerase QueA [Eubacterium sp.]
MKTSDFYYDLPEELIAQDPLTDRSASRLMVLNRTSGIITHKHFTDITDYLRPGDCLVRNNTKVIPARLFGHKIHPEKDTPEERIGASVEVFLLKRKSDNVWETLVRPGKKLREGAKVSFSDKLSATIESVLPDGNRLVKFEYEGIFEEILDELGQVPLPPYIKHELKDADRYQTVYAKYDGSAAAPTAGLHFTDELLAKISAQGIQIADVTLHVGLGTFRPVKVDDVTKHHMHTEFYRVTDEAADIINTAKQNGGRIICVGTTSCRTIESATDDDGIIHAGEGDTDIFIYPGYRFKLTQGLITNFHLPESTLLMLVSALSDRETILAAYAEAVREKYRFFSFGDAMLII